MKICQFHEHHIDSFIIQGPEVAIENSDINLGLVRLGEIGKGTILLRNTSQVSASWKIYETEQNKNPEVSFLFS